MKTFLVARERADIAANNFRQGHLEIDEYSDKLPTKDPTNFFRARELAHEGQELRFGAKERTENENLRASVRRNEVIDFAERNMQMVYFPDWRPVEKSKWVGQRDFYNKSCLFRGGRAFEDAAWKTVPIGTSSGADLYSDGSEAVGQHFTLRQRDKSLEVL